MEKEILYKYDKMELEQFAVLSENFKPSENVEFETRTSFAFDKAQKILVSKIDVRANQGDALVMKGVLNSFFRFEDASVAAMETDGRVVIPAQVLIQAASLCYGSLRGIIFDRTIGTQLCNVILPPIYFNRIIDKDLAAE